MAVKDCPLPEVGEALEPYIKTREEVAAIRRGLHAHLESQLKHDSIPLTSVNLASSTDTELDLPPSSISGVRKTYWKALQAHNAAQAKYDALRADLERLKHQKSVPGNSESRAATAISDDYIPLLRQREKQRRLKAIEGAYSSIVSAGGDLSTASLDDIVKTQVGEMPARPSSQSTHNQSSEAQSKILELKKALISTKRRVDERRKIAASPETKGSAVLPQPEITGLQNALQQLTAWMESQLTIISNAEASTQSEESPAQSGEPPDTSKPTPDIADLYEKYLEARARLVQTVKDPPKDSSDPVNDLANDPVTLKDASLSTKPPAEILLPYIPALLTAKQEEQALMQQSTYIRRHLTSAETATERLLHRLADESHLVQPGASSGTDWAAAAKEADDATRSYVKARVQAGEASVGSAGQAMDSIKRLPASLDPLL